MEYCHEVDEHSLILTKDVVNDNICFSFFSFFVIYFSGTPTGNTLHSGTMICTAKVYEEYAIKNRLCAFGCIGNYTPATINPYLFLIFHTGNPCIVTSTVSCLAVALIFNIIVINNFTHASLMHKLCNNPNFQKGGSHPPRTSLHLTLHFFSVSAV